MTNPETNTDDGLPHVAQLVLDRSMAHFFCTLIGLGRAIHDEDPTKCEQRSKLFQMMLWSEVIWPGQKGEPIDHNGFHRLEDAAFKILKAADPAAYQEAFGDEDPANEPRRPDDEHEHRPDHAISPDVISLLEGFFGVKIVAVTQHPEEPEEGGGPAKKARKRRGKNSP